MKRNVPGVEWRVSRRLAVALASVLLMCGCYPKAVAADPPEIWQKNYEAALKQAAAENKFVLIDFSGSDWCGWCIKLDKEVFSQDEFISYAKDNLIPVLVDFPRKSPLTAEQKKSNEALAQQYKIQGFPTVLILNPKGEVVERTGYQPGGAAKYVEFIKGVIAGDNK